jgi:MFS family permease
MMKFFRVSADANKSKAIIYLCLACYFWGIASSMTFSLLPIYIVDELGGDSRAFGALVGSTTFFSIISKVFTGFLIDIFHKKKAMLCIGGILTLMSKLLITCFASVRIVFISKLIDRFAQGVRHASTDIILTDLTKKDGGFAFSLRHATNLVGYATGSIATSTIVFFYGTSFRLIFIFAIIPAIVALYILKEKINYEPDANRYNKKRKCMIKDVSKLSSKYWHFIAIVAIIMFNRFNEGFITLRAHEVVADIAWKLPLFMSCYEIFNLITAVTIGKFIDKLDKEKVLIYGIAVLLFNDILAIFANDLGTTLLVYIFAGVHMGATHWVLLLIVTKLVQDEIIGTAFAVFYVVEAVAVFCSNYFAGGPSAELAAFVGLHKSTGPFIQGCLACLASLVYLIRLRRKERAQDDNHAIGI